MSLERTVCSKSLSFDSRQLKHRHQEILLAQKLPVYHIQDTDRDVSHVLK